MPKWVNLAALRKALEEQVAETAVEAGIEHPRVVVHIELPDARGRRAISVQVTDCTAEQVAAIRGRAWDDN